MKKCIVTVLGEDTVGIIAKVCTYLAENEINILLWMIISINLDRIENHFIGSILIFQLLLRNNFE